MIKVDLITGFLGAGKTTFLKKYAGYFIKQGKKVGILENDYGAVNVDMLLLNELRGDNCELEMVAGACDDDCHKRRFKTKLISMGMSGYDRVIIEPSGIFDVDEFFDSLREDPLDRWYEIGNVITIVDAKLEEDIKKDSDGNIISATIKVKDGVTNLDGSAFTDKDLMDIKLKISKVNQSLNGAFNEDDKGAIHRGALGRLMMQFRQWMPAHYSRRFRGRHWDADL